MSPHAVDRHPGVQRGGRRCRSCSSGCTRRSMRSGAPTKSCSSTMAASDRSVAAAARAVPAAPGCHTRGRARAQRRTAHGHHRGVRSRRAASYVITLDADLQNPPEEIAQHRRGDGCGRRLRRHHPRSRHDVLWRKAASRLMNRLRERTTSIRITDQGCMLRGYHRNIVDAINRCLEVSTYVPALGYTFARHPVEIEVGTRRAHRRDSRSIRCTAWSGSTSTS